MNLFDFYYQERDIWSDRTSVIVPDTNVLLHLHRYPSHAAKTLFSLLERLGKEGRLWVPGHVGLEYHVMRSEVIADQRAALEKLRSKVADLAKQLTEESKSLGLEKKHRTFRYAKFKKSVERFLGDQTKLVDDAIDELESDGNFEVSQIKDLVIGHMGPILDQAEIDMIETEGKERFAASFPPGHMDQKKTAQTPRRPLGWGGLRYRPEFGDLIIWKQMLTHFSERSFVFVTDDRKQDWYEIVNGERLGPRVELRAEAQAAGVENFHFCSTEALLRKSESLVGDAVSKPDIEVAKDFASRLQDLQKIQLTDIEITASPRFDAQFDWPDVLHGKTASQLSAALERQDRELREVYNRNLIRIREAIGDKDIQ